MSTRETIRRGYVDDDVIFRFEELLSKGSERAIAILKKYNEREARTEREPSLVNRPSPSPFPTHSIHSIADASTDDIRIELMVANDIVAIIDMNHFDGEDAEEYVRYRDALRDELKRRDIARSPLNPNATAITQSLRFTPIRHGSNFINASTTAIKSEMDYLEAAIKGIEDDVNLPDSDADCYRDAKNALAAELNRRIIEKCKFKAKKVREYVNNHSDELVDLTKCSTDNLKSEVEHLDMVIQALAEDGNNLTTDAKSYADARKTLLAELKRRGK